MHHIKPIILKPNGKKRSGKGFSPTELKKAGTNPTEARKIGLPTDIKRKTAHDENVETIKAYVAKEKSRSKTETPTAAQAATQQPEAKKKPKSKKPP